MSREENTPANPVKLPVDHHLHTWRCGHADGEMAAYVGAAGGLAGVGFNDHLPFLDSKMNDPTLAMSWDELPAYVEEVSRLRDEPATPVLLGIEADYIPGQEKLLAWALADVPWDYVYGSVHLVGDWPFDDSRYRDRFERADVDRLYREYYGLVAVMAATGLYDVWSHPDVPKKFGHFPSNPVVEAEHEALAAVARAGMVLEINTSGLRKPVGEIYPAPRILRAARAMGVPITFGSDAHRPDEVGYAFARAVALARAAGYTEYVTFANRRKIHIPLPDGPAAPPGEGGICA